MLNSVILMWGMLAASIALFSILIVYSLAGWWRSYEGKLFFVFLLSSFVVSVLVTITLYTFGYGVLPILAQVAIIVFVVKSILIAFFTISTQVKGG